MKAILATLFATTALFSALGSVAADSFLEERTLFKCPKTCSFPTHAVAICSFLDPCGFICDNGYIPEPLFKPKKCVCKWPLKECNGKCGLFNHCPSKGHHKRDITAEDANCPVGLSACGILGRHMGSWECIDTQKDLESCGGCMVSIRNDVSNRDGQDCTAIPGVADVSCVSGQCRVKKCMDGYEVSLTGDDCVPIERKKNLLSIAEEVLINQFGA